MQRSATQARHDCSQIWMPIGAKRMVCARGDFLPSDVPGVIDDPGAGRRTLRKGNSRGDERANRRGVAQDNPIGVGGTRGAA